MSDAQATPWPLRAGPHLPPVGVGGCLVIVLAIQIVLWSTSDVAAGLVTTSTMALASLWRAEAGAADLLAADRPAPNRWLQLCACAIWVGSTVLLVNLLGSVVVAVLDPTWEGGREPGGFTVAALHLGHVVATATLVGVAVMLGRRRGRRLKTLLEERAREEEERRFLEAGERLAQWRRDREADPRVLQERERQRRKLEEQIARDRQAREEREQRRLDRRLRIEAVLAAEEQARATASGWSSAERRSRASDLLEAIERHSAGQMRHVPASELATGLGWPEGELTLVVNNLAARELVRAWPLFTRQDAEEFGIRPDLVHAHGIGVGHVMITQKGFEYMDQENRSAGNHFGGNLLINSIINVGDRNSAVAGSPGASATVVSEDEAAAQLKVLIAEYRAALDTARIDESAREQAVVDLDTLERQLDRRPLSKPVIAGLLGSLRSLAEGVVGNAAFAGLAAWLAS